jgi:hypothetical protein
VPEDERGSEAARYPVAISVAPALEDRNRLTAAFRFFLALPHLILVGAPVAMATSVNWGTDSGSGWEFSSSGGLLSIVAGFAAIVAWFAILFAGRHPEGLWKLSLYYLRWRVRAAAYLTLLRDEYPPFGEGLYPVDVEAAQPEGHRDRVSVGIRLILAIPHIFVLGFLGVAWAFTTAVAWAFILFTGRYPRTLYGFGIGVLAWTARAEAYILLLRDEYPPFTLRA